MRQKELNDIASSELGVGKEQAARTLETVFNALAKALKDGDGKVPLAGLGTFHVKETKARKGRHPTSGAEIDIPSRRKVTFKASGELMVALNGSPDDDDSEG